MAPDAVLGLDLGTSAVKASVYTLDGELQTSADVQLSLRHGADGLAEQDLDEFYDAAARATHTCLAANGFDRSRIGAVAMAGQMAGVGLVDRRHRPLAPYDSWLDTRCGDVAEDLARSHGERITRQAGCAPTISIGPKMVWWARTAPEMLAQAGSFVTAAGYVAGRAAGLDGDRAFIDRSYLHFASVADAGRGQWDEELAAELGLQPRLLPRIVESTEVIGEFTAAAAEDFGLLAGTPIAAGCGDTAASPLGAGVSEPGQAFDTAGTAAVFGVCLPVFTPDTSASGLMTMRSALPGRWYALSYVSGAGQMIEWLCREILGHDSSDAAAYAELARITAAVAPGSDGVIVSPHFSGRVAPRSPAMRGAVLGMSPTTTRGQMARAALEAIAFEYRGYADLARASVPGLEVSMTMGAGGGSRLTGWNQIKADVLGAPYQPVVGVAAGTRGTAILAMASIGVDAPALPAHALGPRSEPDAATREAYDAAFQWYAQWSDRLAEGYTTLGRKGRA